MPLRLAATLVIALAFAPGCSHACTLIGCESGISVEILRTGGWEPGSYTVKVTAGPETFTCSLSWSSECSTEVQCSSPLTRLWLNPCAVEPADLERMHLQVLTDAAPGTVLVRISREGEVLGEESFTPSYASYYPNGPECDPEPCRGASVTMNVP